jgi:hypothetical protein
MAKNEIESRKDLSRKVGFMFLSDGQDTDGTTIESVIDIMSELSESRKVQGLHVCSFGYGHDYDSKMLTTIPKPNEGKFYYINNVNDIEKGMAHCFGEIITYIAKDLELSFSLSPFTKLKMNDNASKYLTKTESLYFRKINHVSLGKIVNTLVNIELDMEKITCIPGETVNVMEAYLQYYKDGERYTNEAELWLECDVEDRETPINKDLEEEIEKENAFLTISDIEKNLKSGNYTREKAKMRYDEYTKRLEENDKIGDIFKTNTKHILDSNVLNGEGDSEILISFASGSLVDTNLESTHLSNLSQRKLERKIENKKLEKEMDIQL